MVLQAKSVQHTIVVPGQDRSTRKLSRTELGWIEHTIVVPGQDWGTPEDVSRNMSHFRVIIREAGHKRYKARLDCCPEMRHLSGAQSCLRTSQLSLTRFLSQGIDQSETI